MSRALLASLALGLLTLQLSACGSQSKEPLEPGSENPGDGDGSDGDGSDGDGSDGDAAPDGAGLAAAYSDYFPIGAAIGPAHLAAQDAIIAGEFNHLTAENAMKFQSLQATEGNFTWTDADAIASYARDHNMKMTGHTFVWHRQAPTWLFSDVTPGDAADLEVLKQRLKTHIEAVVDRYADVVDSWDVVNEAISDDEAFEFRQESDWTTAFAGGDYVYHAFQFAHDALEAKEAGSSAGKLYYNDYNMVLKIDRVIAMLDAVRERGAPVDGIGFQGHWNLYWPPTADIQAAFDKAVAAGYKVKVSELDITVYSDYPTGTFMPQEEVAFTEALETQQAERYRSLFALFRANKEHLTSVTFWGIADDQTWLDNEPVAGRNDYPLLWDDNDEPKAAYDAIASF